MLEVEQFTLRNHTAAVKALAYSCHFVGISQQLRLYSGDDSGMISEWDIPTRRLLRNWKIHVETVDAPVIGIGVLPYDLEMQILYVHSKDHCIRFYDVSSGSKQNTAPELLWDMPVNTLNFSNVLVLPTDDVSDSTSFKVWCCNTEDTEGVDVYEIDPVRKILKRLVRNLKFGENSKRGIVMRFLETKKRDYVAVGYENGSCVLVKSSDFSGSFIEIPFDPQTHTEQPVLSLASSLDTIFIGQAKNNMIFKYGILSGKLDSFALHTLNSKIFKTKELSISNLCGELVDSQHSLGFTTWETNGFCQFSLDTRDILKVYEKSKSNVISVSIDPTGNIENPHSVDSSNFNTSNNVKIGDAMVLPILKPLDNSKQLIKRLSVSEKRFNYLAENNWCVLGFNDGSIMVSRI